jgi:hypothetical protein
MSGRPGQFRTPSAPERRAADRFWADLGGTPYSSRPFAESSATATDAEESDPLKDPMAFLYWDPARGRFPGRAPNAPSGSEFMKSIAGKERPRDWQAREDAITAQLINGNFPDFLLRWEPVVVSDADRTLSGRVWVMPDYLSIGSDQDWAYIPMSAPTAQRVADGLRCILPTAKLCHDIYLAASYKLPRIERDYWLEKTRRRERKSAPKDCSQVSTCAYEEHSNAIKKQMSDLGVRPGSFVAGHKKDVIITRGYPADKIAFQGFYTNKGIPAEPCNERRHRAADPQCRRPGVPTVTHERWFSDYAQGVRLARARMKVDGEADPWNVADVLAHDRYHKLLSPAGAIVPPRVPDVPVYR